MVTLPIVRKATPSSALRRWLMIAIGDDLEQVAIGAPISQPTGAANGISSSAIGWDAAAQFGWLCASAAISFAIRFSSSDAGSSFGSCGTSLPRTARLRMVWRSCLIWSGRVVRAGSASRAKRASAWKVSGSGALRRARLAAASRSRVASRARPRRLQPVAQRHQLIDLGDDAVLFGEGWEGNGRSRQISADVDLWHAVPRHRSIMLAKTSTANMSADRTRDRRRQCGRMRRYAADRERGSRESIRLNSFDQSRRSCRRADRHGRIAVVPFVRDARDRLRSSARSQDRRVRRSRRSAIART